MNTHYVEQYSSPYTPLYILVIHVSSSGDLGFETVMDEYHTACQAKQGSYLTTAAGHFPSAPLTCNTF